MATFKINDGVVIDYTNDGWAEFKKWLDGTYASLKYTWVDEGQAYNIIAFDGQVYRTCSINKTDAQEFEEGYRVLHPSVPHNASGMELVQVVLPEGRRCDVYTPNFCDKTTWYQDSLRVEDEEIGRAHV